MDNKIKIENLSLSYSNVDKTKIVNVFSNFNISFDTKKLTCVIGHSGCGKTTLLRLLMGFIKQDEGLITIPSNIKIGMMFQEDRLMPWLNLYENVIFGLKTIDNEKVEKYIEMVGLQEYKNSYPFELSGGMRQRVALARILVNENNLLLMDEPFSALDVFTRKKMQDEILKLKKIIGMGIIFVTHSIEEVLRIADIVVVLKDNKRYRIYNIDEKAEDRDIMSNKYIELRKEILLEVSYE